MTYNQQLHATRWMTKEVKVGSIALGGNNPIRIQSMTTTNTRDVEATVAQVMQLSDAGCEIVRITVQGMKEADSCEKIKNTLIQKGYNVPLVADIHFYPPAAMRVVEFVDKVRINPGNFADKRAQFKIIEYDDHSYSSELARIEDSFAPLVERCKTLKKALRIGTNHGSLSDRIMNRYGDSPKGMVESALEFARIARALDFHNMVFSMKASNPKVMVEAYRLLVDHMRALGWNYPLHLGVTEAGQGEDGRIKSALGIGTLLMEGIGDTIRVSLTEDPLLELTPARNLSTLWTGGWISRPLPIVREKKPMMAPSLPKHPVIALLSEEDLKKDSFFSDINMRLEGDVLVKGHQTPDGFFLAGKIENSVAKQRLNMCSDASIAIFDRDALADALIKDHDYQMSLIEKNNFPVLFFEAEHSIRSSVEMFYKDICSSSVSSSIILSARCSGSWEEVVLKASAECGSALAEGRVQGLLLQAGASVKERISLSFGIMQAARLRSVKTEFISCPGCGRTLFDLQEVSSRIEKKTAHLPGVKIAIMGCIVNGPGEMADADFGYVGSKAGHIDLYIGKDCVERNIPMQEADARLIELIKSQGRWIEPK